jgi:hypothetical protein
VEAGGPAGGEGLPRVSSRNANAHPTHRTKKDEKDEVKKARGKRKRKRKNKRFDERENSNSFLYW